MHHNPKYDCWLIEAPVSVMPAPSTYFENVRVIVKMESISDSEKPIAHDAYPNNISREIVERRKVGVRLSLNFVEVLRPRIEYVDEIEFTRLEPVIKVAGIGTSEPIWGFSGKALSNHGDAKTLYIIAKTPQGTKGIYISFILYAEVSTKWRLKLLGKEYKERTDRYMIPF